VKRFSAGSSQDQYVGVQNPESPGPLEVLILFRVKLKSSRDIVEGGIQIAALRLFSDV
jgi:hypothetical protein